MSYKKQQIILQIVTSALQRCRVKASGRGPTSSAKWTRYPHHGHSAHIHSQKKQQTNQKTDTKKPRAMWTYALGMLTGQANIDPYDREDSWDQATRIFKVTSLRSAIRCFFLENKEHVL